MTKWTRRVIATILCLCGAIYNANAIDIFPSDRVVDIQITVAAEDWDKLRYQSRNFFTALHENRRLEPPERPYTYVEASVTIDGVVFPRAGIRKKGFLGSLSETRPSLKIKLNYIDKDAELDRQTHLTLNNNQQDTAQVSQFMGYALFNAIGLPAPRCAYAKVTVNGMNLGIYSHVESIRKPFLKRVFGNDDGPLYEGTVVDFYEGWENSFEHKRGDNAQGRTKIQRLIDVLAIKETTEEAIGELVDLDAFYRFWATESLLGFWDGYAGNNNNFFVYLHPDTDKFHFVPWGADSLFLKHSKLEFRQDARAPISVKTQGLIAHKLYQLESGRERYAKTMMEILNTHWNEEALLAELDSISALITPHLISAQQYPEQEDEQARRWRKDKSFSYKDALEETRQFIQTRRADILEEISNGMPVWRKRPEPPFTIGDDGEFKFDVKAQMSEDTLWGAAVAGKLPAIEAALAEGTDVNAQDDEVGLAPLAWAALHGQTEAMRLLIEKGADVNARSEDGNTPLHVAAFLGQAEAAKLLIDNGADINARDEDGETPADVLKTDPGTTTFIASMLGINLRQEGRFAALKNGRQDIAKLLHVDETVLTATTLWEAAYTGNLSFVKQALADGADANAREPQNETPLLTLAALMGHADIAELLIENGADVNALGGDGGTALHAAAFLGRADAAKVLLDNGADATIRDNNGSSPHEVLHLDWNTTMFIANLLQIKADRDKVEAGRKKIAQLLR